MAVEAADLQGTARTDPSPQAFDEARPLLLECVLHICGGPHCRAASRSCSGLARSLLIVLEGEIIWTENFTFSLEPWEIVE